MPLLQQRSKPYWDAYWTLRKYSQNVNGSIPLSEIQAWLDIHKEDDVDERERFLRMVLALEDEWRQVKQKKNDKGR